MSRARLAVAVWAVAASFVGLAGCPAPAVVGVVGSSRSPSPVGVEGGVDAAKPAANAEPLLVLTDRAVGPYLAWGADGGMVAYVGGKAGERAVMTLALGAGGEPLAPARAVAAVGTDANALSVRRVEGRRYVISWTALTEKGEALSVLTVGADGALLTAPAVVAQSADDIVWSEVFATGSGAVCVWAEQTRGGDANLLAVGLGTNGQPRGVAGAIARGVLGWQAVVAGGGVGVAMLRAPKAKPTPGARVAGSLGWLRLDAEGRAVGDLTTIVASDHVGADFDVARVPSKSGDTFVFAYTERSGPDPEVAVVSLSAGGEPSKVTLIDSGQGGHALVGLTGNDSGALLSWEDARTREVAFKRVHTALIQDASNPAAAARGPIVEVRGDASPETRSARDGFAWLAPSPACVEAPCSASPVRPVFLRFGRDLAVAETQAVPMPQGGAAIAWSLDCDGDRCAALTASGGAETRVSFVDLSPRASGILPPLASAQSSSVTSLVTLTAGGTISDVAAVRQNNQLIVTSLARSPDAKSDDAQSLSLYLPGRSPSPLLKPLSTRATATGSVAMSPTSDGAMIAWVFREGRDAQVHGARVDVNGKRTRDVTLTTSSSAKTDVAAVAVDGGFVVAWVDWRDGNGEVYALRLGPDLSRVGREERITNASGDASDLALLAEGDHVIAAWADPRESAGDGFSDIYAAALASRDAKVIGHDARILATSAHSRSPSLGSSETGARLVWIEDAPASGAARSDAYGAMTALLDSAARPKGDPQRLRFGVSGVPTSITLDAAARPPRGVVAIGDASELGLWLFSWVSEKVVVTPIVSLDGPPTLDVPLALTGRELLFADDGPAASDARLRHGTLSKELVP